MEPDRDLIETAIRHLAAIERGSASPGEREAAEWIAQRLRDEGLAPEVSDHPAHGGYWLPLGVATAAAGVAGLLAARATRRSGRRRSALATVVGTATAAAVWDDLVIVKHWTRRLAGRRKRTWNVVAQAGDASAEQTLVLVSHHDAAHAGAIFDPRLPEAIHRKAPWVFDNLNTSPPLMWLVFGGPVLVAVGGATGSRRTRGLGTLVSLGAAAAFADIAARRPVPGANDNLSGVATLLAVARLLAQRPVTGLRVLLVSTGSEESFEEGMQGFAREWWPKLPRESTRVLVIDTVGSPQLTLPEREGMLRPYGYDADLKDTVEQAARDAGVNVRRGLKFSFGSDALIAVRDGYRTALLGSIDHRKSPANYHWPTDHADNIVYETVVDAARAVDATIRTLAAEGQLAASRARAASSAD